MGRSFEKVGVLFAFAIGDAGRCIDPSAVAGGIVMAGGDGLGVAAQPVDLVAMTDCAASL
ncbi:hypothetical protein GCM10009093_21450 [Brevundimonas terrae]|uniref:Uncharacterized protein n=1 Tax=Brevundimonas terrae TaxID=363631 RepID=A0ABP3IA56_9CAUL